MRSQAQQRMEALGASAASHSVLIPSAARASLEMQLDAAASFKWRALGRLEPHADVQRDALAGPQLPDFGRALRFTSGSCIGVEIKPKSGVVWTPESGFASPKSATGAASSSRSPVSFFTQQ